MDGACSTPSLQAAVREGRVSGGRAGSVGEGGPVGMTED